MAQSILKHPQAVMSELGQDYQLDDEADISVIAEAGKSPELVERVESYVRWLRGDTHTHDHRRAQTADRSA